MTHAGPRTGVKAVWGLEVGTYTVTLTVTDNNGATNVKSQTFTVQ